MLGIATIITIAMIAQILANKFINFIYDIIDIDLYYLQYSCKLLKMSDIFLTEILINLKCLILLLPLPLAWLPYFWLINLYDIIKNNLYDLQHGCKLLRIT